MIMEVGDGIVKVSDSVGVYPGGYEGRKLGVDAKYPELRNLDERVLFSVFENN
jgi:hypothetical protein